VLEWLEMLPISEWVATSDWGYPILLSVHTMGLAIVVGILVMLDARVLGAAKSIPMGVFERLIPLAWAGFVLNLVSGVLLFMSMAPRLAINWPFLSKLAAIILAGLVSWLLWKSLRRDAGGRSLAGLVGAQPTTVMLSDDGMLEDAQSADVILDDVQLDDNILAVSSSTKRLAIASLFFWFLAILFGRLIAYVLDAMMLAGDF
jgi:hypothetical protein